MELTYAAARRSLEVGGGRSEVGGRRSEVGGRRSELEFYGAGVLVRRLAAGFLAAFLNAGCFA